MKINKILFVIFGTFCLFALNSCDKKTKVINEVAVVRTKEYRSVTVINRLSEKLVKECTLTTASGVMVDYITQQTEENIVFKDFDRNEAFENDFQFKIKIIDKYGLTYEKEFTAAATGNTDVFIEETDNVKQPGDWKRQIEKKLN